MARIIISTTIDPVIRQICKNHNIKISNIIEDTIKASLPNFQEEYDKAKLQLERLS